MATPTHLRVEHLDDPMGIMIPRPRLSWRLPAGAQRQLAYRLRAGDWDSGRVESDQSLLVPYDGSPVVSSERVSWTVKVWTDNGESDWAEAVWWETGLLAAEDWVAQWIEPIEDPNVRAQTPRPAYRLRHAFFLNGSVKRARVFVTAHGIYEFFVNGNRVGDAELTPGFTSYWSNLQVQAFDVTELLKPGDNVLGAVVSDGWFRGQNGGFRLTNLYGDGVALLAQLHVYDADGLLTRVGTGPEWVSATGSIRAADLFEGQIIDFGAEVGGWLRKDMEEPGWSPVAVRDYDLDRLRSSPAPPARGVEQLHPLAVSRPRPDRQVIDLGQNINGWVRLTNLGPAGTKLILTYGEALDADGDVTLDHLTSDPDAQASMRQPELLNLKRPFQIDQVTSTGDPDEVFEPRHTAHGFRYVRVEGHPSDLGADDVTGVVVHTDLRRTGWFECSDSRINRLHEAAVWSFRGNACDIPTDCPTRERAGWTGDWQIFVPTAAFLYDVAGFSVKWLRDLAADQLDDGVVPHLVPNALPADLNNRVGIKDGSAGWGDAAVIVPWEIYRSYGDRDLLAEQWPSMTAWVDYAARMARERRHPSRIADRPTPSPHEEFIWDTGFHWGEWLEPGEGDDLTDDWLSELVASENGIVATAYLHYSSRLLAEIAKVLGRDDEAKRYSELADATRAAWQAEFIRPDGTLTRDTQASYVRALAFDLAPVELRPQLAQRLVDLIRKDGTHLGTGFLATPYLLPVLADAGRLEVAYELLSQDTEPSWLTMIDRGATTIWEGWNGIDADGTPHLSLNHYSKGAVISFLHCYVAGIRLLEGAPAYRRFRIAPVPGGGITWARGVHESPYGRIESSWRIDGDRLTLDVTVPPGTSAEVLLPDGQQLEAQPGNARYDCAISALEPRGTR